MWSGSISSIHDSILLLKMDNTKERKPKVSVCMIAYNVEKFISEAIESVLKQEADFEIELVISNDNSSDRTEEVVFYFMINHPRGSWIKYFRQEKNLGMMNNYMWTFKKCQGDYLSICDSDDFWTDERKLFKQVEFLDLNRSYVLSFHNSFQINEKGEVIKRSIDDDSRRNITFWDLTQKVFPIPTASIVFRNPKNIIFPREYLLGENHDTFLFILLAQYGDFFYDADIGFSAYRIHSNGTWSSRTKAEKSLHSLETFLNVQKVFPNEKGFKKMVFQFRNNVLVYSLKEKKNWVFLKEYPKNFFLSFTGFSFFKDFLKLHLKMFG